MVGRHREFDRERAVRVAMMAFWKHGYGNVSVNKLCQEIGIARSSFYNTFGSLEGIFEESLAGYSQLMPWPRLSEDPSLVRSEISATQQIREFVRTICRFRGQDGARRGCLLVNNLSDMGNMGRTARSRIVARIEESIGVLQRLAQIAVDAGELPEETDTSELALALQTLLLGINTMSRVVPDEERLWSVAAATLDGLGLEDAAATAAD